MTGSRLPSAEQKAIREMQPSQSPKVAATFDEVNLVPSGRFGAGDAVRPADRAGIPWSIGWAHLENRRDQAREDVFRVVCDCRWTSDRYSTHVRQRPDLAVAVLAHDAIPAAEAMTGSD